MQQVVKINQKFRIEPGVFKEIMIIDEDGWTRTYSVICTDGKIRAITAETLEDWFVPVEDDGEPSAE